MTQHCRSFLKLSKNIGNPTKLSTLEFSNDYSSSYLHSDQHPKARTGQVYVEKADIFFSESNIAATQYPIFSVLDLSGVGKNIEHTLLDCSKKNGSLPPHMPDLISSNTMFCSSPDEPLDMTIPFALKSKKTSNFQDPYYHDVGYISTSAAVLRDELLPLQTTSSCVDSQHGMQPVMTYFRDDKPLAEKDRSLKVTSQYSVGLDLSSLSLSANTLLQFETLIAKDTAHRKDNEDLNTAIFYSESGQSQLAQISISEELVKPSKNNYEMFNIKSKTPFLFVTQSETRNDKKFVADHKTNSASTETVEDKIISSVKEEFLVSAEDFEKSHTPTKNIDLDKHGMDLTENYSALIDSSKDLTSSMYSIINIDNGVCSTVQDDIHLMPSKEIVTNILDDSALSLALNDISCMPPSSFKLAQEYDMNELENSNNVTVLNSRDQIINYGSTQNQSLMNLKIVFSSKGMYNVSNTTDEHSKESNKCTSNEVSSYIPDAIKAETVKHKKTKYFSKKCMQYKKSTKQSDQDIESNITDQNEDAKINFTNKPLRDCYYTQGSNVQDYNLVYSKEKTIPLKQKTKKAFLTRRRSCIRKSKDNAMRLIELQAYSYHYNIAKTDKFKTRTSHKQKKIKPSVIKAVGESGYKDVDTKDYIKDSSYEDYSLDTSKFQDNGSEDVIAEVKNNKHDSEKKRGSLKISFKLKGNSFAEIISGIDDFKSNRKYSQNKVLKTSEDEMRTNIPDKDFIPKRKNKNCKLKSTASTFCKINKISNTTETKDEHSSLTSEHIHTKNSVKVKQKIQKKVAIRKRAVEKHSNGPNIDNKKAKFSMTLDCKSGTNTKKHSYEIKPNGYIVNSKTLGENIQGKMTRDKELSKFVCGYCPQRYNKKVTLIAHMEAHIAEMEKRFTETTHRYVENKSAIPVSNDSVANKSNFNISIFNLNHNKKTILNDRCETAKPKSVSHCINHENTNGSCTEKPKINKEKKKQKHHSKKTHINQSCSHTPYKSLQHGIAGKYVCEREILPIQQKSNMQSEKHVSPSIKSDQKITNVRHEIEDHPPNKRSRCFSFAAALRGELDTQEDSNKAPDVLVLKRNISAAEWKTNSAATIKLPKPHISLKPNKSNVNQERTSGKSQAKSNERQLVNSKYFKSETIQANTESTVCQKPEALFSDPCHCKECPECVTRFLKSFE